MKKFLFLLILLSCKSQQLAIVADAQVPAVVSSYLAEDFKTEENQSATFALFYSTKDMGTNYAIVKYVLYEKGKERVVRKGTITQGYIKWISDTELELLDLPEVLQPGKSSVDYKQIITTTQEL